jgi:hypothetical protein
MIIYCCYYTVQLLLYMHRLLAIGDTVGMGSEIVRTIVAVWCCALPQTILIALATKGIIPVDTRIHVCQVTLFYYVVFDVNILSRRYWGIHSSRSRGATYKGVAAVISSTMFNKSNSVHCESDSPRALELTKLDKSLHLLRSPPMKVAYAQYVEKALCYESYKFLVEAVAYRDSAYDSATEQVLLSQQAFVIRHMQTLAEHVL